MNTADSQTLLAEYVRSGSEAAFQELVSRYIDWVYSTALRLVKSDTYLAEDITQIVFTALAQKARTLPSETMLGGWLHRHTCYVAATTKRTERRRQARERQAMELNALEDPTQSNLARIAPVLDDAINQLGEEDRAAILLRFYEQHDFRSLGEVLGSSEDAARMRVNRALDKLHSLLTHRGITLSGAALGTALATEAVTAAPKGLALSISGTALGSAAAGGTVSALGKVLAMNKVNLCMLGALVVTLAVPLVSKHQSVVELRRENEALKRQISQLRQLEAENERLSAQLAQSNSSPALTSEQWSELLKLRSEVGRLRRQSLEARGLARSTPGPLLIQGRSVRDWVRETGKGLERPGELDEPTKVLVSVGPKVMGELAPILATQESAEDTAMSRSDAPQETKDTYFVYSETLGMKWKAAEVMSAIAYRNPEAPEVLATIPLFQDALQSCSPMVRHVSAQALGAIGAGAAKAVPALILSAADEDSSTRLCAVEALGRIGVGSPEVVQAITKALDDPAKDVRSVAKSALKQIGR